MKKIKHIFNESLAKRLSNSGYQIVSIRKKHKNKDRYVFLFEETDRFLKDFTVLSNKR
jgi:hypothetical protein